MKGCFALIILLPAVISEPPAGWVCHKLNVLGDIDKDCVVAATFGFGDILDIKTKTVGSSADRNRMCVISLTGDGIEKVKDFYIKADFNTNSKTVFGGVTYNMKDNHHGNYILMRMKSPVRTNMEAGYLEDGEKTAANLGSNNNIRTGQFRFELVVKDGEETVLINGVKDETASDYEPNYQHPGTIGIGLQNVGLGWNLKVRGAELCNPISCLGPNGPMAGGDVYENNEGKPCTCGPEGITCECKNTISCSGGTYPWIDPETCDAKCIRDPAYCSSSGDPHYRTFGNVYYDMHGTCSYQAASCGDFKVFFKNYDLFGRAPTFTGRIELEFKEQIFAITNHRKATVDGASVQVPYVKRYTNGDRVEIVYNGNLEIYLFNKGRNPSVRLIAKDRGSYIDAGMFLHGSCLDITEGICGNPNKGGLIGNNPNTHAEHYKKYDESCPAPPKPYHPCDDVTNGYELSAAICDVLKNDPFKACNAKVDIGDSDGGIYKNCQTDVCHCFLDEVCACSTYEDYATQCKNSGVDIDWTKDVTYCPLDCPAGMIYNPRGSIPPPSCLQKDTDETGTARGCFCPLGTVLEDGVCIDANKCKCLHEGKFYEKGDDVTKEGECQVCTCQDYGDLVCEDMVCPDLNCKKDELLAYKDDKCCPYCDDSWVVAVNPEETIKKGQDVSLTCKVLAKDVPKRNIVWFKGDKKITQGLSKNRLKLTINDADANDDGTYRCQATKDGKVKDAEFKLNVILPAVCTHEDGTKFDETESYMPQPTIECTCVTQDEHTCECVDDGEICQAGTVEWFDDSCIKTCVPEPGVCSAAADPHYTTFDGTQFDFKGDCKYNFFSCGDVAVYADHEKDRASTHTKSLDVLFKKDTFTLEGKKVTLNGEIVDVPLHKSYSDGSLLSINNVGDYKLTIIQNGKQPLLGLTWNRNAAYSIKVHGTCKGETTGLCGTWNDLTSDDFTGTDGKVKDSIEEFGTSWALIDEADCPVPPPPKDVCLEYGLSSEEPKKHMADVLSSGSMGKCSEKLDTSETVDAAVEQICGCFGDNICACDILEEFALKCEQEGYDMDNWRLDNEFSVCAPKCPDGSSFKPKGPKPAPTCANPNGGTKSQRGCFCPEGEIMENDKCISKDDCKCEYAGKLYNVFEKYNKEDICETCTCLGSGKEECEEIACQTKCKDNEIEVKVEGECCHQCNGDWVSAVNPEAEGEIGEPLALTCKIEGLEITDKTAIKWFKFNPGEQDITKLTKVYSLSKDSLTLTIKKMDTSRIGNYKCVVQKGDKKSEASFEVTLPVKEEDLIEAVKDFVDFVDGPLVLEVKKLGGVIKEIYWVCNGKRVNKQSTNIKIINKKAFNRLTINPATLADKGSCTCHAKGVGTADAAKIFVGMEDECDGVTCNKKCKDNELEKQIAGECCPRCLSVKAVNPDAKGKVGASLALTCKTEGFKLGDDDKIEVKKAGNNLVIRPDDVYTLSDSGVTWIIKSLKKSDEGNYKCVVSSGTDIKMEASFKITVEVVQLELVEAREKEVEFINGEDLFISVRTLTDNVQGNWVCNGKQIAITSEHPKPTIDNDGFSLRFSPATIKNKGSCTFNAIKDGIKDSAEVKINMKEETKVTITPVGKNPLKCKLNSRKCRLRFKVKASQGKVTKNNVKICKVVNGERKDCKKSKFRKKTHTRSFGKKVKASVSGTYVCVVNLKGKETVSSTVTVKVA